MVTAAEVAIYIAGIATAILLLTASAFFATQVFLIIRKEYRGW